MADEPDKAVRPTKEASEKKPAKKSKKGAK
jgi:hypothetical protein